MKFITSFIFILLFSIANNCLAFQAHFMRNKTDSFLVIDSIIISGNKKTKRHIILRELTFSKGDTLSLDGLDDLMRLNENHVMNTKLFVEVDINPQQMDDGMYAILIQVKERWYIFPSIIFELIDRNFNEWWVDRNRELNRTIYGVTFTHENFRGRNEKLKTTVQLGFNQKLELFYTIPFIDKNQKTGIKAGSTYSRTRSTSYNADDNFLSFYEGENYVWKKFTSMVEIRRREKIYTTHFLNLEYDNTWVSQDIVELNPNYFLNAATSQEYFSLNYTFQSDHRDFISYPLKGYKTSLGVHKIGLGIFDDVDILTVEGEYSYFLPLSNKFYLSFKGKGKGTIYGEQPFNIERAMGYSQDFVRGYEYYVINGQHYLLNRNAIRFKAFSHTYKDLKFIPIKSFNTIPISLFFKVFIDNGFVWDHAGNDVNPLANQYLRGYGAGIDLVTYYDMVFRLEYSINKNNESDFFLHFVKAF